METSREQLIASELPAQPSIEKLKNMIFRSFIFRVIFIVVLIVLSAYVFFLVLETEHLQFTLYGIALITILLTYFLIHSILEHHKKTNHFLETFIVNESFPKFRNKYQEFQFRKLEENLNRIASSYGEIRAEKEAEQLFLENLVEQVNVGILVFDDSSCVHLVNNAFKKLFGITSMQDMSILKSNCKEAFEILNAPISATPTVLKILIQDHLKQLSVKVSGFKVQHREFKLAIIHDITHELNQEEIESWQKLIRILRHEIVNSITPITTLATTLKETFEENNYPEIFKDEHFKNIDNTYQGLKAIEKRGEGLMEFVKSYKELSTTLKPKLKHISSNDLLNQVKALTEVECKDNSIELNIEYSKVDFTLFIDEKQIIQVLLNLVKNAIQASSPHHPITSSPSTNNKKIKIKAWETNGLAKLSVTDNGEGISDDHIENIFVPFYTTREGGSGIGLSICQQIMQLHKGNIIVKSEIGKTEFILEF